MSYFKFSFIYFILLISIDFNRFLDAIESYSLKDVISLTLLNNPELNSFSYDMRAEDAKTLQASFYPNPGIDLETENIGAPIFSQTTLMLNQLIEIGNKRNRRLQFAISERNLVGSDYEVLKRQLYVETTLLFIDVLINQEKLSFLKENLKNLETFSEIVEKRVRIGKASPIEESNFIVLLNSARIDVKNAETELKKSKNNLSMKWGISSNDNYDLSGSLDGIPNIISFDDMKISMEEHPQMIRSYVENQLRASKLALEKSKAYPDVNLRLGPRYLKEASKWVLVMGVSVPFPINDRNQGRILESKENLDKMEIERQSLWLHLENLLRITYSSIETLNSELSILKNTILPAAKKAYEFTHKGFESARYNYLELIETERAYRMTKMRYLESIGEYHKSLTVLQGLTGSKPIIEKDF